MGKVPLHMYMNMSKRNMYRGTSYLARKRQLPPLLRVGLPWGPRYTAVLLQVPRGAQFLISEVPLCMYIEIQWPGLVQHPLGVRTLN